MTFSPVIQTEPARPMILLGAGGHGSVLLALAKAAGRIVAGVCDPKLAQQGASHWLGLRVLGDDSTLLDMPPHSIDLLLGIGQLAQGDLRRRTYRIWRDRSYSFPALIHPASWVSGCAELAQGVQVMAGVVIQPGCRIGENTIVNTRVGIDHDCTIGPHAHIAPSATLCGGVRVGDGAFIGAGAVLIQGVAVGEGAVIGAGVTLVRNVEAGCTVVGAANRLK